MQKIGDIPNTRADSNGEFTDGNVAGGVPPTILPAEWFNTIQRELVEVVQVGGLVLDPNDDTQILAAMKKLFLQAGNNLSEIKAAGPTAIATVLVNLGLGDVSAPGKTAVIVNSGRNANGYWKKYNDNTIEMHGFASTRANGTGDVILPIPLPSEVQFDNVLLTAHYKTNTPSALRGIMVNDNATTTTSFSVLAMTSAGVDTGMNGFSWRLTHEVL
ncbi:bacteriophage tail fiber protein [Yersinia pekkanenii]|uniref:Bacteriophage tail fiber protein n=1 Tax=Yersinia pekkanenii TaxID=1288385 RepID=A0A0T9Q3Z4_9GAMM|nr:bacteriophage tail fiber protein [Yersinia pekkanenii]CRY68505.1 bacteriophage tail fiber protein [Yersinia pekkanenii]